MARIKKEDISQEVEKEGWKLISDSYENLDGELIFQCSEGHRVFSTWRKIREKRECPICKDNKLKELNTKIIPKQQGKKRVLALDQATYITGWAIYDGVELVKYGTFETRLQTEQERNNAVKIWLINMINIWKPDYIGIEDIHLQKINGDIAYGIQTFKILAHLQGLLLDTLYENKVKYEVCSPSTWRAHCKVTGKTKSDRKRSMQLKVKQWFDISVSNDEADAIGIGKYVAEIASKKTEIVNWE